MARTRKTLRRALNALGSVTHDDRPREFQRFWQRHKTWLSQVNLELLGVRRRQTNGATGGLAVVVHIRKKLPEAELPKELLIPKEIEIPGIRGMIPLDVIEIGTFKIHRAHSGSLIYPDGIPDKQGTLGVHVARNEASFILGSMHAMADFGRAPLETEIRAASDHRVLGRLSQWERLDFSFGAINSFDAAIAEIAASEVDAVIPQIGASVTAIGHRPPRSGINVKVIGPGNRTINGKVITADAIRTISYFDPETGMNSSATMSVVLCDYGGFDGLSGAAVLDSSNRLIGLHLGGTGSNSEFCQVKQELFTSLNVQL